MNDIQERPLLFWIPMVWNGLTLLVFLVVGATFFIGSRLPGDAGTELPDIIMFFFAIFDFLMIISPLTLIVTVLISVFNVLQSGSKMRRFLPLIFSGIIQGALSALFLASITRPVG